MQTLILSYFSFLRQAASFSTFAIALLYCWDEACVALRLHLVSAAAVCMVWLVHTYRSLRRARQLRLQRQKLAAAAAAWDPDARLLPQTRRWRLQRQQLKAGRRLR